ncbi:acetyltransferase-like isoleucine patch superfamily enzyme [Labedaea rhizosphaerae]|uniref:Acetyltransferase n=1 Tax=Labedaea rhizosphaerae TaxID=598644 RepID=A0A4R6RX88_LABRH|nr:acetyltransferase-like isoleucine patch superfamily enzyme [Labedaea rhizosphaerae]
MTSSEQKRRMLAGEPYRDNDPQLVAERKACQRLLDRFNATTADEDDLRGQILGELLGGIGAGSWIMPRFQCDYGSLITLGANSFLNYDAILMDCAPIVIGDDVSIGPRAQLLTALHPIDDHRARRERWETAKPITIGDNVWFGGGVIVCPGVTVGANTVVGAGSVVTRDLPAGVFAAGNPCRVIRSTGWVRLLRDALAQLAMDADAQREALAGSVITDELALDLSAAVELLPEGGGLDPGVLRELRVLNDAFTAPPGDPLWNEASLDTHPVWVAARDTARRLLPKV